jgi:hypothetical protein
LLAKFHVHLQFPEVETLMARGFLAAGTPPVVAIWKLCAARGTNFYAFTKNLATPCIRWVNMTG